MAKQYSFLTFIALFLLMIIVGINLAVPADTQAHPEYGFTPVPTDDGGGDGGGGSGGGSNDSSSSDNDSELTDFIIVQLDQCDLACGIGQTDSSQNFEPLASIAQSDTSSLLVPINNSLSDIEILIRVRLIHKGTGWIVDTTISDTNLSNIPLPYPGEWEIFLLDAPQFVTVSMPDVDSLNLAQLQAQLANGPVSLGIIQANSGTQLVKCPIACVIEEPVVLAETPFVLLPDTGTNKGIHPYWLIIGGLLLISGGLLALLGSHWHLFIGSSK